MRDSEGASPRGDTGRRNSGTLYTLAADGKLKAVRVRVGLSDGISTEVVGREVTEGMKVVVGVTAAGASTSATPVNPLGGQQQGGRRGGGFGAPF